MEERFLDHERGKIEKRVPWKQENDALLRSEAVAVAGRSGPSSDRGTFPGESRLPEAGRGAR